MPRYFFNTRDDHGPDFEGMEFPDDQAARSEAIRTAGEILTDIDGALTGEDWIMDVTDEAGRLVLTRRLSTIEHGH